MKNLFIRGILAMTGFLPFVSFAGEHDHSAHDGHDMEMPAMLGPYAASREGSGSSWVPEASPMDGVHVMTGDWMLMTHCFADIVANHQGGPRGDDKVFVPSMLMVMAARELGDGTLGLRTMLSLDPLMGKSGYPLLFQTGETADGQSPLVDRQHPHDFFMELAASYSIPTGFGSVFGYAGLPGEPALGPATFMHRASGVPIPEAPLSHHWLDSTHITFGVVTLGATSERWKLDVSAFNGREPDQSRWNIETARLDSYSGRISFNPSRAWSVQASYAHLNQPEQLEPEVSLHRFTGSLAYSGSIRGNQWDSTLAIGINREQKDNHSAYLAETVLHFVGPYSVFGRLESIETGHLFDESSELAEDDFNVSKLSLGLSRELARWSGARLSLGAVMSGYSYSGDLNPAYGSNPVSGMLFLRTALSSD